MNRKEGQDSYAALCAELRAAGAGTMYRVRGQPGAQRPRERGQVLGALVAHCRACFRHYEGRRGKADYDAVHAALWLRRWWLHTEGKHDLTHEKCALLGWRAWYERERGVLP